MKFRSNGSLWRSWLGIALIIGCAFTLLVVSGCGKGKGGGNTPEKTVQNMFDAIKDKDLDGMLACFAPDVREMFDEMIKAEGKEKVEEQLMRGDEKVGKLEILSTKIDGEWADVETSVTVDGKADKDTLRLHKIGRVWLVDMSEEEKKGMKAMLEMMRDPDAMKKMMEGMGEAMKEGMKGAPEKPE